MQRVTRSLCGWSRGCRGGRSRRQGKKRRKGLITEGPGFYHCQPPGNEKPVSGFKKPCGIRRFVKQCAGWVGGEVSKKI